MGANIRKKRHDPASRTGTPISHERLFTQNPATPPSRMPSSPESHTEPARFTPYQKFIAALLSGLQFAVILDLMIMSPLGAMVMPALSITPKQFGLIVSVYAFSAGISGLLTAGFADRFDRKKLLLFFYTGFVLSTLWCGLARSFEMLLAARMVTGIFGGVIGSIVLAIAIDLFPERLRGRMMGLLQSTFSAGQVVGLPAGLYLSNHWDWHAPFMALAAFGAVGGLVILWRMQPVTGHLALRASGERRGAAAHLWHTLAQPRHLVAFAGSALLTSGGFMLMPFNSAFTVNNLGIPLHSLPTIYLVTGLFTMLVGPLVGKAADSVGKLPVFLVGCAITIVMVTTYTHLGTVPLAVAIGVNVLMFLGIFSRLIPFQALVASVPEPSQRGAFAAVTSAIQQLAGGVASLVAGHVVSFGADGRLQHFPVVGYLVVGSTLVTAGIAWHIQRELIRRAAQACY
jgi:predicted MFS family arabinose efflux permease